MFKTFIVSTVMFFGLVSSSFANYDNKVKLVYAVGQCNATYKLLVHDFNQPQSKSYSGRTYKSNKDYGPTINHMKDEYEKIASLLYNEFVKTNSFDNDKLLYVLSGTFFLRDDDFVNSILYDHETKKSFTMGKNCWELYNDIIDVTKQ